MIKNIYHLATFSLHGFRHFLFSRKKPSIRIAQLAPPPYKVSWITDRSAHRPCAVVSNLDPKRIDQSLDSQTLPLEVHNYHEAKAHLDKRNSEVTQECYL